MRRSSGLSRQQLKLENIRRCQKAGVPVGAEPEKPIGLKAYRQKVKQSAKEAAKAEANTRSMGVAVSPGSLPESGKPTFELGDDEFFDAWRRVEAHLEHHQPQFIIFQCGADSLEGDPLAHLRYTEEPHAHAARRLMDIAGRHARGRILAVGGGGYNRRNLARAWTRVVREFVEAG